MNGSVLSTLLVRQTVDCLECFFTLINGHRGALGKRFARASGKSRPRLQQKTIAGHGRSTCQVFRTLADSRLLFNFTSNIVQFVAYGFENFFIRKSSDFICRLADFICHIRRGLGS